MENTKISIEKMQEDYTKSFTNNYSVGLIKGAMSFVYEKMQLEINELKDKFDKETIIERTRKYAVNCHASTNHKYDKEHSYELHLNAVFNIACKFIRLVPENDRACVLAACYAHDLIEDCRLTYNDVAKETNRTVAELVYALTNEKGKNRDERANDKYYSDMKKVDGAVFVKICDRIANYEYSKTNGDGSMAEKYKKEMNNFVKKLYRPDYNIMFDYLNDIK